MTITGFLSVLVAFLQFPKALVELVRLLKGTPQEHHEALIAKIATEQAEYMKPGGRPKW